MLISSGGGCLSDGPTSNFVLIPAASISYHKLLTRWWPDNCCSSWSAPLIQSRKHGQPPRPQQMKSTQLGVCITWLSEICCCFLFFMGINFCKYVVRPCRDMECSKEYKSPLFLSLFFSSFFLLPFLNVNCLYLSFSLFLSLSLLIVEGKEERRFECEAATLVDCSRPSFSLFFSLSFFYSFSFPSPFLFFCFFFFLYTHTHIYIFFCVDIYIYKYRYIICIFSLYLKRSAKRSRADRRIDTQRHVTFHSITTHL